TAAGNSAEVFDNGPAGLAENRDLALRPDSSKFYPAYFSREMKRVISVTTVDNSAGDVCSNQNYGGQVVDLGVEGDNCSFRFKAGDQSTGIAGTSYAAPIVSGW